MQPSGPHRRYASDFLPSIFMAAVRARPAAVKVPDRLLALIIFLCCPLLVQMESRLEFKM